MLKQTNIKFKRRLTVAGLAAIAIAALIPFSSSSAWGPENRKTFTNKSPADYPVFNSITDNAGVGDERNFVRIKEVGTSGKYVDTVNVTAGKEYEVYIYFHNNAKTSLNKTADGKLGPGVATQVKVSTGLSAWTINSSKKIKVSGVISSSNTNPASVWDEAYLTTTSKDDIVLKYVTASAKIHNSFEANNSVLSDKYLFSSEGTYIGVNKLNGYIPGCAEYSGHITYRIRADVAKSTISKTVSKDGKNFYETVDAKPGDTLTYKVVWKNTGTLDLTNVTFHDKLPTGVTLVNDTTMLYNNSNPNGVKMSDSIGKTGFKTGLYGKNTTATITYKVTVNKDAVAKKDCNSKTAFTNKIFADYNVGSTSGVGEVYDSSTIYVTRVCEPEKKEPCKPDDKDCICKENPKDPICEESKTPCKEGDPECPGDTKCDPNDKECICTEDPKNPICEEPCEEGDPECPGDDDECDDDDVDCICKEDPTNPICNPPIPKTGPGEIALAIVAVVCIATGGIYWYRSQKDLATIEKGLDKGKK